jgi:diacylglycerol kinase family enzyme/phosphatidylglycerophosphate synthase
MLATIITFTRVLSIPIILYFILAQRFEVALIVFSFAIVSDILDSIILWKRKIRSFFDPIADKILVSSILIVFAILGVFRYDILFLFIARDLIVGLLRFYLARDDLKFNGSLYGKVIVVLQYAIIYFMLVDAFYYLQSLLISLAVLFSIISALHYVVFYFRQVGSRVSGGRRVEEEKIVILANKRSRGFKSSYRRHLLRVFARRRSAKIVFLPNKKNMFEGIEKKLKGYDHIIIAGGDGTFEGALNYKPFHKKSIGFFPLGAGNAFYSYFYKGKRFEYLRSRFHFHQTQIDVLEIEMNGIKRQTLFMGIGIDAHVIRLTKRSKNGLFDYVAASYRTLVSAKGDYDVNFVVDSKKYKFNHMANFMIGKIPFLGFGIKAISGNLNSKNNLVYVSACINTRKSVLNKYVRLWGLILTAMDFVTPPLYNFKGGKVEISSKDDLPIHAGGEFLGFTNKVKVRVVRKQSVLEI